MNNLFQLSADCLRISDPQEKIVFGQEIASQWQNKVLELDSEASPIVINNPGAIDKPEIVPLKKLSKRGFRSDKQIAALLHALAHIEMTAVNLSWDSICRYPGMPQEYYQDWINTAIDEGKHFLLLQKQMQDLGYDYGDFVAHGELWEMAVKTGENLMHRMAIVHRVLEARALDVVPASIKQFEEIKLKNSVKALTIIANDEVRHVAAGSKWYRYCCQIEQCDPDKKFFQLIKQYMKSPPRGPFNAEARTQAGFSSYELEQLNHNDINFRSN
ncbi:MAG: ferritin-like domain-containing protein [Gammaproteobacteria bacterium]|nr:ferritin-like domain-containing protein [Gammaproteobacteria bacterium]